jgi:hypothetical protein
LDFKEQQAGAIDNGVQENDTSFLTSNMKSLLDDRSKIRADAGSGSVELLDIYVEQLLGVYSEWCRQEGRVDTDLAKARLRHYARDPESSMRDILDIVLHE